MANMNCRVVMKINYQETTTDLIKRINIHNQYGSRNIDEWMLQLLNLKPGLKILDVACGSGKQCFSFHNALMGEAKIIGGDVSQKLLSKARQENLEQKTNITFTELDFNKTFIFPNDHFDLVSCCFAIYYAENITFTLKEIYRVLKPGGRLFTTGPMPENKQAFYEVIREATHKTIPPMPGSSRYNSEILGTLKNQFPSVEVHIFENPLTFIQVEPFIEYTRASLSEDRKLWGGFFKEKDDFEKIINQITEVADMRIKNEGKLVMTKVVGGFISTK